MRSGRELPAGIREPKKNGAIFPTGHGKAAKAQPHFAFGDVWMHADGPGRDSNERIESGERAVQKHLSLAVGNQPAIHVASAARIDLMDGFIIRIAFVKLQREFRVKGADAMRNGARRSL